MDQGDSVLFAGDWIGVSSFDRIFHEYSNVSVGRLVRVCFVCGWGGSGESVELDSRLCRPVSRRTNHCDLRWRVGAAAQSSKLAGGAGYFRAIADYRCARFGGAQRRGCKSCTKRNRNGDEFWGTPRTRRNANSGGGAALDVAGFCCVVDQKAVGVLNAKTLPTDQVRFIRRTKRTAL
jgi:hypothetical protein